MNREVERPWHEGFLGCLFPQEGPTTWNHQDQSHSQTLTVGVEASGAGVPTDPLREQPAAMPAPGIFAYTHTYVQSYTHELMHFYPETCTQGTRDPQELPRGYLEVGARADSSAAHL